MTEKDLSNYVGPVIHNGDIGEAVLEAIREDNPGRDIVVVEHASYFRIKVEDECVIVLDTVAKLLGRPISAGEIEVAMPGFSGFIRTSSDRIRFLARS